MSCLFCKNFAAVEPDEHRLEREGKSCQYGCGTKWDAHTAARYVKRHKLYLNGSCHLNPVPAAVRCEGICARFEDGFYPAWGIGQPGEKDNLRDWAREKMQDYIFGDYQAKELDRLREDNEKLKAALKAARQRSAARLVRLNKAAKKKERPTPVPLRLVAAE